MWVGKRDAAGSGHETSKERGAMLPLLALVLVALLVGTWMLAGLVSRISDRTRAQSAADTAALAGVVAGESEASAIALSNGARLVSFEESRGIVQVTVEIDGVRATASAELAVPSAGG